jgi:PAS domain-containing protein
MKTILVVEDSRAQAERLCAGLIGAGFGALRHRHARHGRVRAVSADQGRGPDLPVVLLTSLTDPLDIVRGLSAGADSFFRKPYDLDQLASRLRGILYTREMRLEARSRMGLELFFLGQRFTVTAERQQLLDLLISSFEDLVTTNEQLRDRERHLAEAHAALAERLKETERERQRVRAVLAALPVGMVLADEQGQVVEVNDALLGLLGHDRDELVGHRLEELQLLVDHRGEPLPAARRPFMHVLQGGAEAMCGGGSTSSCGAATAPTSPPSLRRPRSAPPTARSAARSGWCRRSADSPYTTR